MTVDQDTYRDLYKNARMLVILKLIFDLGGSATVAQMSNILGIHHESVTTYIYLLADRNLVARPHERGGWFLTKIGMQYLRPYPTTYVPQTAPKIEPPSAIDSCTAPAGIPPLHAEIPLVSAENPPLSAENPLLSAENPLFKSFIITSFNTNHNFINSDLEIREKESFNTREIPPFSAEKPPLPAEIPPLPDAPKITDDPPLAESVWLAFSELGILRNPTSEAIAATPGLTYDGVMKTWREISARGRPWIGLLLQIIPTLKPWELRGHTERCYCQLCYQDHERLQEEKERQKLERYGAWTNE